MITCIIFRTIVTLSLSFFTFLNPDTLYYHLQFVNFIKHYLPKDTLLIICELIKVNWKIIILLFTPSRVIDPSGRLISRKDILHVRVVLDVVDVISCLHLGLLETLSDHLLLQFIHFSIVLAGLFDDRKIGPVLLELPQLAKIINEDVVFAFTDQSLNFLLGFENSEGVILSNLVFQLVSSKNLYHFLFCLQFILY